MARSAALCPRKTQTSPVRVRSTAASRESTGRSVGSVKLAKVLGIAGLVGVAATGAAVARSERRRRAYTPEEIRARLHERYEQAQRS